MPRPEAILNRPLGFKVAQEHQVVKNADEQATV